VKLLTGTLSPSDGELLFNGIPAERSAMWHDRLSAVAQNPVRYVTFTVADNVFFGDTAAARDEAEIAEALSFAGLDDIGGADTLLGKEVGGAELSGGQWQKLAIARAAYRGRELIILDEPTSNLDPLAEADIFQKYMALADSAETAEKKTVIFVTHRISVASLADRIVVFANGKIIQDGTHEELMAQGGEYRRLYSEQAKWYNR
jgi:ATP-binding cassette subfamily B protein